ncbi:MAG: bifunctional alpha,alpha-trehalose-phosphate synthase (UDP-forming)/trehalose-phosphatase [Methanoculleaceae archaeon]
MPRTLIVSNRLPVTVTREEDGSLSYQQSAGGLAIGLGSIYRSYRGVWIGWPGISRDGLSEDEVAEISDHLGVEDCHPLFLNREEFEGYYNGFSNKTIWPLFHYFPHHSIFDPRFFNDYLRVNRKFADTVVACAEEDDIIWVHDYHLMLLPGMLRERLPDARIGFFLHIPFPSYEIFRLLYCRRELLEGILGADLVGFHTFEYARYFLNSVMRILGKSHENGVISMPDRPVRVDAFPMGIDYNRFRTAAISPVVEAEVERIRTEMGGCRVILSFDRLDYTKGIPRRLEAFYWFLERYPQYRGEVTLLVVAVPSRSGIGEYRRLKDRVDRLVGKINGRFGTLDWIPVRYIYQFLPFETLVALYRVADVAMVTPLRDGMNLMAKEYIACRQGGDGMLILSEFAGAAGELSEAVVINPCNMEEFIDALDHALSMPRHERAARNRSMQERLLRYNVSRWAQDFLDRLDETERLRRKLSTRFLSEAIIGRLISDFRQARKRLLLLDYDGTLVPFAPTPELAWPDPDLYEMLEAFAGDPQTTLVLISGRPHQTLEEWFGAMDIGMVADHGAWIREAGGRWEMQVAASEGWKEPVRKILECYVDRTPGAFIEEKDFSLSWHYRRCDPSLAEVRVNEIITEVSPFLDEGVFEILEGDNVLEVIAAGIDKGIAARHFLMADDWDFVLAAGDDRTDEHLFEVLSESMYSIKVGTAPSWARYRVGSSGDLRRLLQRCHRALEESEDGRNL